MTGAVVPADHLATTFRAAGGGRAPGLRIRPLRQPDAGRPSSDSLASLEGATTATPSPAAWPPRTPSCGLLSRATTPDRRRRLRGDVPAPRPGPRAGRHRTPPRRDLGDPGRSRRRLWRAGDPARLGGDAEQPLALDRRHRRHWPSSPTSAERHRRRGQHLRHPLPAEAPGAWRRRRGPLDHQVPGRPLRRGRRLRRARPGRLAERIGFLQNATGAVPGPFDCYLVQRGVKTLAVRMDRHAANAGRVAEALEPTRRWRRVYYPGCPRTRATMWHAARCAAFGGMVSFTMRGWRGRRPPGGRIAPRSSRWPSPSGRSSRSSSIPAG